MSDSPNKKAKLDIECIFSDLKAKIHKLDAKIILKEAIVHLNYNADVEKVTNVFDEKKIPTHEDRINEQRQQLIEKNRDNMMNALKKVEQHRDKQIEKLILVKIFDSEKYSTELYKSKQAILKNHEKTKENLISFAKLQRVNYAPLLSKYEFSKPLNILKFHTYNHLLKTNNKFQIFGNIDEFDSFEIIPSNRLLVYFLNGSSLIIDETGTILHSREHAQLRSLYNPDPIVKVSISAIVMIFRNNSRMDVEIYDFKLNLVESIRFSYYYYSDSIFVNNYNQVVFKKDKKILIYNIDYSKKNYIVYQYKNKNEPFFIENSDRQIHINEKYLYLTKLNSSKRSLYMINRINGKRTYLGLEHNWFDTIIKFDNNSNIYDFNKKKKFLFVYNYEGVLFQKIGFKGNVSISIKEFSLFDKIIYNFVKYENNNQIQYSTY